MNQFFLIKTATKLTLATACLIAATLNGFGESTNTNGFSTNANVEIPSAADAAWAKVEAGNKITVPDKWHVTPPTREEQQAFLVPIFHREADLARDFYQKFPADQRAPEAKFREYMVLKTVDEKLGDTNAEPRLKQMLKLRLADPQITGQPRMILRLDGLVDQLEDLPKDETNFLAAASQFQKEYPGDKNIPAIYSMALRSLSIPAATKLAKEIQTSSIAEERTKLEATNYLEQIVLVGKPLDLKFTALKGEKVDLSAMKGKVVLVDYWATWCPPCMAELPHVIDAYNKFHPSGFEVVGINCDHSQGPLEQTLDERHMVWPQYFDGSGASNPFNLKYGVHFIPAMWLIGKDGIVRTVNAEVGLEEKVKALLAEK